MNNPFEKFAQFYDEFMEKLVDYPDWVEYVIELWRLFDLNPKKVLDLACGTGIPSLLLLKKGYEIIGLDKSKEMLSVFNKKLARYKNLSKKVSLIEADMRDFFLPTKVNAALALYDSVNYLLSEEDLKSCFYSVYKALDEQGIFLFDMNTIYALEYFWANNTFVRETKSVFSIWQNSYDPESKISALYLTCFVKNNDNYFKQFQEIHKERGYEYKTVIKLLREVGFRRIKIFQHLTFLPPKKETARVMYVALKNSKR